MNPAETVIVIRSLVPGGVAQMDGRLVPGDRLLYVNDVDLDNAHLDQAVQALKGAARGIVRIGVAKPLPLPEIGESSTDDMVSTHITCYMLYHTPHHITCYITPPNTLHATSHITSHYMLHHMLPLFLR